MDSDPRPPSDGQILSDHVAAIVDAAERASADLLSRTEARARERIAEADRASDNRVQAAEDEAREIIEAAERNAAELKAQATAAVQEIHNKAAHDRSEAEAFAETTSADAVRESEAVRAEADAYAVDVRGKAKEDARDVLREAHGVAGEVMDEGTLLSSELQQLSDSLRRNAERLLQDIRIAHNRLTAGIDDARPEGTEPIVGDPVPVPALSTDAPPTRTPTFDDVPEFIPPP
jgi:vacuolar-type H+-ATPase subunit H